MISAVGGSAPWSSGATRATASPRDRYHVLEPRAAYLAPRVVIRPSTPRPPSQERAPGPAGGPPENTVARLVARRARVQGAVTEAGRTPGRCCSTQGATSSACARRGARERSSDRRAVQVSITRHGPRRP
ncbi:hypothetical protein HBB16_15275 [Pseudonocardia sp. MCCB 268]|nr:hypothetical protein [Pseudonocardia cytotoxica]